MRLCVAVHVFLWHTNSSIVSWKTLFQSGLYEEVYANLDTHSLPLCPCKQKNKFSLRV